ncbi:hypothetical protein N5079_10175 [Planotetraspora sp. A-T 1434]|uniref:hypothetical protein n=1 Tax=Planotetraspora sp. A-T 1434 TaxID=2979219 RepID=UPI0021BFB2EB|nr:hypothetical protein [Planotetraspora sp. A-T 1434]MCT9930581.1 hypothetical protein [Planotetraspora sp. A-T 1434]
MSLNQWRSDEASHAIEISVRNDTSTPVRFHDVQLVTDSFVTLPPAQVETTLGKTPRTDFQVTYGEARCDPAKVPSVKPATVAAHLQVGNEPLHEVRFVIPHPDPLLAQLVTAECGAFILRQSVDVTFGASWAHVGKTLHGVLMVTRKGGNEPITVDDLGNTTHFDVKPLSGRHRPVIVLAPGSRSVEIPVEVTPARCDMHAFAEAKKAYLFPVWATVGGGKMYWLISTPSKQTQATFLSYAETACGYAS